MDASSKPLVFAGMCIGKEPFASPHAANKVLRRWRKAKRSSVGTAQVYRCPACGAFHIGNAVKSRHNGKAGGRAMRRRMERERMV